MAETGCEGGPGQCERSSRDGVGLRWAARRGLGGLHSGGLSCSGHVPLANGKIAFQSDRPGTWDVYAMNADGSGQTNLTYNSA